MVNEHDTIDRLNNFLKTRGGLDDGTALFYTNLENVTLYGRVLRFVVAPSNLTFRINAEFKFRGKTYLGMQSLITDAMHNVLKLPNSERRAQKFDSRGRVYIIFKSSDQTQWLATKIRDILTRDMRQALCAYHPPDESIARDAAMEHSMILAGDAVDQGIITVKPPTTTSKVRKNSKQRRRNNQQCTSRTAKLMQRYESVLRRVSGKVSGTEAVKHLGPDTLATVLSLSTLEANQIHSHASQLHRENSML